MRATIRHPLFALVLLTCLPQAVRAQYSRAGLLLGAHAAGMHLRDDAPAARGALVGILLGHGVGEHALPYFGVDAGWIHDVQGWSVAAHADLGVRLYPLRPAAVAPFATVAFSGHGRDRHDTLRRGDAFTAGIGTELRTSHRIAATASLTRTWGSYDDDGTDVVITRAALGVSLRAPR